MSVKLRTLDVQIIGCGSTNPIKEFQIPDTGAASVNLKIAELVHRTLLGAPYECTRCSGGDYHFHQTIQFVGPITHHVDAAVAGSKILPRICCSFEVPVDKNGIPFVASYDCC
jgi:hypothetical protein